MKEFDVPVSLHIFNRPETIKLVLDALRQVRPKYLYVTADGPRKDNNEDVVNCSKARKIIDDSIDWDCELHKNYSETNKGSYKCTSDGISWVFQNVDEAIILEDDCVPDVSFFMFCKELLERYRNDLRIGMISGNNFITSGMKSYPYSYYFSKYNHIWGWATWKRTWQLVDLDMSSWPEFLTYGFDHVFRSKMEKKYWKRLFNDMYEGRKNHWDYKMFLSMQINNMMTIIPSKNLVTNIGVGHDATNCRSKGPFHCLPVQPMDFPLSHPSGFYKLHFAEEFTERNIFSGSIRLKKRIARKIKEIIPGNIPGLSKR
ncbi:glycosyltransferase family 2 protein [Dissulfurirhabdus thermomarina]|uniref:Glycosyltransferase family 2 protein n=1 Tax=Dissulfurirhabdus thermomarina TaxID=1765737 RepID=A0A6N9TM45_DISTH|nr:glycosyltransferase family 2 protein [Dissulfurirhabdus thermomarina]NDY42305.1 glycosyltransferase family 2 protein [Dissulfurirhabdus thermomarina]NMX24164.1 glycosyltransferase family 2 protein [Dissulfurirhabdus thermomarina]